MITIANVIDSGELDVDLDLQGVECDLEDQPELDSETVFVGGF